MIRLSQPSAKFALFTHRLKQVFTRGALYSAVVSGIAASTLAYASDNVLQQTLDINLPQQRLARSVTDLAEQAGLIVLLKPGQFQQQDAQPVHGSLTLNDALDSLLKNSGYRYEVQSGNTLVLVKSARAVNQASSDTEKLVVYGTNLSRYEFDEAHSATGFIADVDELPRTVQVLPEQLVLDQNASDLTDVLINAAGVTRAHGFGGAETQVNIRGFTNSHMFVDGNPVSNSFNIDIANVESAEVILGPASILHGQVSPGGLVNIITKKPQADSAHAVQMEADNQGKRKLFVDSTGALTDTLQYRIVVSGEDSESFREVTTTEGSFPSTSRSLTVAPSVSYTPDEKNTYTLRFTHAEQTLPIDRGTVAIADANGDISIADIPRSRRLGSQFDERDSTEDMLQLDWDHEFSNGWVNRFKAGYYEKNFEDYQSRPVFGLNTAPANFFQILGFRNSTSVQSNGLLARIADSNLDVSESDFFISDSLTGDYRVGDIDNTLYLGANYYQRNIDDTDGFALTDISSLLGVPNLYAPAIDVVNIDEVTRSGYTKRAQTAVSSSEDKHQEFGFSVQNLSYLTPDLNLLAGLRYDRFEVESDGTVFYQGLSNGTYLKQATPTTISVDSSNHNVSGQLGLIYRLTDEVSLYSSYAESFLPNYPDLTAGVVSGDSTMDPEEASQFEVGAKASLMDDKLRVTLSLYDLKRKNVLTYDNLQARLNGEEETRGADLSATMQFIPGLNVLASYSYMDSKIIDDNDDSLDNEGNRPFSIPKNKARIWGSYEFQGGNLAGLGLGLGAEYVDERFGNDDNTFSLPGYTIVDAASWYYIPLNAGTKLRLQAGVKNLTNKHYFPANGSGNTYRINVGDPRTLYLTARLEF